MISNIKKDQEGLINSIMPLPLLLNKNNLILREQGLRRIHPLVTPFLSLMVSTSTS